MILESGCGKLTSVAYAGPRFDVIGPPPFGVDAVDVAERPPVPLDDALRRGRCKLLTQPKEAVLMSANEEMSRTKTKLATGYMWSIAFASSIVSRLRASRQC